MQNGRPMDWVRIAALAWVAVALPLALLTGRYLRRADQRENRRDVRSPIDEQRTAPGRRRPASRPRPGATGRRAPYRLPGAIARSRRTSAGCIYGGTAGSPADTAHGPEGPGVSTADQPPGEPSRPQASSQGATPRSSRNRPPFHRLL